MTLLCTCRLRQPCPPFDPPLPQNAVFFFFFGSRAAQLPVHSGVQIELDYFFIDSWDEEFGRIYVDNALVWSHRHGWRNPGVSGDICGHPSFGYNDMVEHVTIQVPEHSARTLTLVITSSLDEPSDSEYEGCCRRGEGRAQTSFSLSFPFFFSILLFFSLALLPLSGWSFSPPPHPCLFLPFCSRPRSFGISNLRMGPIMPQWPKTALFDSGTAEGWEGGAAQPFSCGLHGTILGGTPAGSGATMTRSALEALGSSFLFYFLSFFLSFLL